MNNLQENLGYSFLPFPNVALAIKSATLHVVFSRTRPYDLKSTALRVQLSTFRRTVPFKSLGRVLLKTLHCKSDKNYFDFCQIKF